MIILTMALECAVGVPGIELQFDKTLSLTNTSPHI